MEENTRIIIFKAICGYYIWSLNVLYGHHMDIIWAIYGIIYKMIISNTWIVYKKYMDYVKVNS